MKVMPYRAQRSMRNAFFCSLQMDAGVADDETPLLSSFWVVAGADGSSRPRTKRGRRRRRRRI